MDKPLSYYTPSTGFKALFKVVKHPILTYRLFKRFGIVDVIGGIWNGELFPPDLKAWKVARGFPRKKDTYATPVIKVS